MKKNFYSCILGLGLGILSLPALSQSNSGQPYQLLFKTGYVTPPARTSAAEQAAPLHSEVVDGYYFRILQFWQLPDEARKKQIKDLGIQLHQYLPRNAYYASVPATVNLNALADLGLRASLPLEPGKKLSADLLNRDYPSWAMRGNGTIELVTQFFGSVSAARAEALLLARNIQVISRNDFSGFLTIQVPVSQIEQLAALPFILFLESAADAPVNDNLVGRTSHRSNTIATDHAMGRHYNGEGVVIAMGDGGKINSHIDYKGRFTLNNTNPVSDHAEHVAGTIMGAGNRDPKARGMAFGAHLHSYQYGAAIGSLPNSYNTLGVRITSNSWSTGNQCNSFYNSAALEADQQTRELPSLLHVFSAGNSGEADCGYGAGNNWGNITGGYKQGKNVIAVANLNHTDVVVSGSSRGPASDGRIKPDISAVGTNVYSTVSPQTYESLSGTSMSTPGVTGTIAQLYHAYRQLHNGADPVSGLMKAIVLNTAEDLGNPGPDFIYGFGRIHALRAVKSLESQTYFADTAVQNSSKTFQITVPTGTKQVRAMVYWTDFEAATNSAFALVNNLNMQLTDPAGTIYHPWILDPTPTPAALNTPAVRGQDDLNNVEQVTIDNPDAGVYTIHVSGAAVPVGPQPYYVIYTLINDGVELTYPIGGEGFAPGFPEVIRWDAFGNSGSFKLEYSADSGSTWNLIVDNLPVDRRYHNWNPNQNLVTGKALVRVTRGAFSDVSDNVFTVVKVPSGITFPFICQDSMKVQWTGVPGAAGYEVTMVGAKYMDSVAATTSSSVVLYGINPAQTDWFSVKALTADGGRGRRAVAVMKPTGTQNCVLFDMALSAITSPVSGCAGGSNSQICITLQNTGAGSVSNVEVGISVNSGMPVLLTVPGTITAGSSLNYCFDAGAISLPDSGPVQISASVVMPGDANNNNNLQVINPVLTMAPVAGFSHSLAGNQYTFTPDPVAGATYSWSFGDGNTSPAANPSHTYSAVGNYLVTLLVTNAQGCTDTAIQTISVLTGLQEDNNSKISVYPNPSSGNVEIVWPMAAGEIQTLEVMNILGQVMHYEKPESNRQTLVLNNLSEGTYLIKLTGKGQTYFTRLVLQR